MLRINLNHSPVSQPCSQLSTKGPCGGLGSLMWKLSPDNHKKKDSHISQQMTKSAKLTSCKYIRVLPRWLHVGQQLWCVLLGPLNSQVFTSSFFGLMHSLLRTSPKCKGHPQGIKRPYIRTHFPVKIDIVEKKNPLSTRPKRKGFSGLKKSQKCNQKCHLT